MEMGIHQRERQGLNIGANACVRYDANDRGPHLGVHLTRAIDESGDDMESHAGAIWTILSWHGAKIWGKTGRIHV
jgi:hypothetical protein